MLLYQEGCCRIWITPTVEVETHLTNMILKVKYFSVLKCRLGRLSVGQTLNQTLLKFSGCNNQIPQKYKVPNSSPSGRGPIAQANRGSACPPGNVLRDKHWADVEEIYSKGYLVQRVPIGKAKTILFNGVG